MTHDSPSICVRYACNPYINCLLYQVLKVKVDVLGHLALNSKFSKRSAEYCLCDLIEKIGDVKNGASVQETLSCLAEATSLEFVAVQVCCFCWFFSRYSALS